MPHGADTMGHSPDDRQSNHDDRSMARPWRGRRSTGLTRSRQDRTIRRLPPGTVSVSMPVPVVITHICGRSRGTPAFRILLRGCVRCR